MTARCLPGGWRDRVWALLLALFCKRYSIIGMAFSGCIYFTVASQPLYAESTACHYSTSELKQILGAGFSATLAGSSPAANAKGTNGDTGLTVRCEGNFLAIDASGMPTSITLKLGVPAGSVRDQYLFSGLASYYNRMTAVRLDPDGSVARLELPASGLRPDVDVWAGVQGRYNVFLVSAPGATLRLDNQRIQLRWPEQGSARVRVFLGPAGPQHAAGSQQQTFTALRYAHLWDWLAALCLGIEILLSLLYGSLTASWGVAIVMLAVTLKLLLLPVSLYTANAQANVNRLQAQLQPKLSAIKADYDGAEAHAHIMAEYKSLGITPFFALRPLPGTLIQLPVLVATFNVLGEMPQLQGEAFFWINDLAYPDTVAPLPFTVPAMGGGLNLLPFIMTLVSVLATVTFSAPHLSAADIRRQKRNLYLLSAVFFLLFYPFPAAMVLYWTCNNILQMVQQRVLH